MFKKMMIGLTILGTMALTGCATLTPEQAQTFDISKNMEVYNDDFEGTHQVTAKGILSTSFEIKGGIVMETTGLVHTDVDITKVANNQYVMTVNARTKEHRLKDIAFYIDGQKFVFNLANGNIGINDIDVEVNRYISDSIEYNLEYEARVSKSFMNALATAKQINTRIYFDGGSHLDSGDASQGTGWRVIQNRMAQRLLDTEL